MYKGLIFYNNGRYLTYVKSESLKIVYSYIKKIYNPLNSDIYCIYNTLTDKIIKVINKGNKGIKENIEGKSLIEAIKHIEWVIEEYNS